jgi:hypothetical protein
MRTMVVQNNYRIHRRWMNSINLVGEFTSITTDAKNVARQMIRRSLMK